MTASIAEGTIAELTRAGHAAALATYAAAGERRAHELANHGPARFDADGNLAAEILSAYWEHGFYVFEGVIGAAELDELAPGPWT